MVFEPAREGQLTEKRLAWGYWWVTHKVQVRRWFTVGLAAVGLALVGYGAFGFLDWYFGSGVVERANLDQLSRQLIDYSAFRQAQTPQPLVIEDTAVLNSGSGNFDLVARVTNPNPHHWVEFDYEFSADGTAAAPIGRDFILPSSVKYVHGLGIKSEVAPSPAELRLTNVRWHRLDPHAVGTDFVAWAKPRLGFRIENARFQPADPSDRLTVSRAVFDLKNATAYGYRRLGFFVALSGPTGLVGVNYVVVSQVRAGETRAVDASWFSSLPAVSSVEVTPDVNILDDGVYIPPGE